MSILIKGMEMPTSCVDCKVAIAVKDGVMCTPMFRIVKEKILSERQQDCPLIEVPPHGRLIDADALLNLLNHCMFPSDMVTTTALSMATNWIKEAPTIIESEGE